jgi:cytochrome b
MAVEAPRVRVWDPLVRFCHWALVAAFLVAWLSHGGYLAVHRAAGYVVAAIVLARVAWGFAGPARARFTDFVPGPRQLRDYLALLVRGREPRFVGHNPAGGVMIVALLALLAGLAATGLMLDTPAFRDDANVKEVHDLLTDAALVCIALHLAGVAYASWRHRENLVAAMVTGRKRG